MACDPLIQSPTLQHVNENDGGNRFDHTTRFVQQCFSERRFERALAALMAIRRQPDGASLR